MFGTKNKEYDLLTDVYLENLAVNTFCITAILLLKTQFKINVKEIQPIILH
jgi:hypothetical protein